MYGTIILVDEDVLLNYVKQNTSIESLRVSNQYELLSALFLRYHFEKLHNIKCRIGFTIKQNCVDQYPKTIDQDNIGTLINKHVDEKTDIDFSISPNNKYDPKMERISIWAFQLKRFGYHQEKKDFDTFLNFLNKIKKKYQKTKTTLVIFFEGPITDGHHEDFEKLLSSGYYDDFPFREVMFISGANSKDTDNKKLFMLIGFLHPVYKISSLDPEIVLKKETFEKGRL
jgi:hypothetical protein